MTTADAATAPAIPPHAAAASQDAGGVEGDAAERARAANNARWWRRAVGVAVGVALAAIVVAELGRIAPGLMAFVGPVEAAARAFDAARDAWFAAIGWGAAPALAQNLISAAVICLLGLTVAELYPAQKGAPIQVLPVEILANLAYPLARALGASFPLNRSVLTEANPTLALILGFLVSAAIAACLVADGLETYRALAMGLGAAACAALASLLSTLAAGILHSIAEDDATELRFVGREWMRAIGLWVRLPTLRILVLAFTLIAAPGLLVYLIGASLAAMRRAALAAFALLALAYVSADLFRPG